jgi:outer membrane lipoprotein SlyB
LRRLSLPFSLFLGLVPLTLAGCSEGYSANTYASTAAQQQAAVERGVIIGVRQVMISANDTIGAAAGGAAGGVAGAQIAGSPVTTAFGTIGGALVGGVAGAAAQQAVADAKGWEYIVQEDGNKLVSVTQTSKMPLPVGLHVLVIADTQQARIVPDYTVQVAAAPASPAKTAAAPSGSTATEVNLSPLLPAADAAAPVQIDPGAVASDPAPSSAPSQASASQAATPQDSSPTSGGAATPAAANNASSATATPSAGSAAASVQVTPAASSPTPPVSSSSTATP